MCTGCAASSCAREVLFVLTYAVSERDALVIYSAAGLLYRCVDVVLSLLLVVLHVHEQERHAACVSSCTIT